MLQIIRRLGIALGSLVIAYLALSLVAGVFFGAGVATSPWLAFAVIVFGALIYLDIIRRERPSTST